MSPGNQVQGAARVCRFPSAFTFPLHLTWTAPPSLRRSSHDRARSAVPRVQLAAAASSSLHPRPGALPPAARHFARSGPAVTRTLMRAHALHGVLILICAKTFSAGKVTLGLLEKQLARTFRRLSKSFYERKRRIGVGRV